MKEKILISKPSHSRLLYWNKMLYNSELFEKNVDILDSVILDTKLRGAEFWLGDKYLVGGVYWGGRISLGEGSEQIFGWWGGDSRLFQPVGKTLLCEVRSYNHKALKVELLFNYKKKYWLKCFNTRSFKINFTNTQESVFPIYYLSLFLSLHFHLWNWFGKQLFDWETHKED